MSIRQHRFDSSEKIRSNIGKYQGKKITLVLSNQTSVLGELVSVKENEIVLRVIVNGFTKNIHFEYGDIRELYYDQVV
jgi:hypothetical protein